MAMATGSGQGLSATINATPLIDVLLVLLIIFLMIQPRHPYGLEAQVPQPPKSPSQPEPERTVVAEVLKEGDHAAVKINQQPVAWPELEQRIFDIYKGRAERVLFIKGDDDLTFDDVARVIDAANGTRLDVRVGLVTKSALGD